MREAPPLQPGDLVGIAAPSGAFNQIAFRKGVKILESWGLIPVFWEDIFKRHRYFAGKSSRRSKELQGLIKSKDIKALLFARGGFGLHYILPHLKLAALKKSPKRIIGYSDLTMLLNGISQDVGVVTYYGPTVCDLGRAQSPSLNRRIKNILMGTAPEAQWSLGTAAVVKGGRAEGRLAGGCLSLLNMSVGTSFEIQTRNKIVLIEDVNEAVYEVERLLLHLKQAKLLQGVKGLVISELNDGKRAVPRSEWVAMLKDVLADFKGPVVYGVRFGHVKNPHILPLGKRARLDTRRAILQLI